MRINRAKIDGYGRLHDVQIEFAKGFQVVAGPNEHGKSTLRDFIVDMLYGQRLPGRADRYEDGRELRKPWEGNGAYGGQLRYELSDGRRFYVERSFRPETESVRVLDGESGADLTSMFPRLKNDEPAYAETHIMLPKPVFMGMATISHLTLAEFGDRESLLLIRDKLLSLTDSGDETRSAESALAWLDERLQAVGRPTARSKPLPQLRSSLMDLQAEYDEVREAIQEVRVIQKQRQGVLEEIGSLLHQRVRLERKHGEHETRENRERDVQIDALRAQVSDVEARMEVARNGGGFSLERLDEASKLATLLEQMEDRCKRTAKEMGEHDSAVDKELERLKKKGVSVMKEADPHLETRLAELEERLRSLGDRIEAVTENHDSALEKRKEAEAALQAAPDFSGMKSDPVEWFSQLAASFESARKARDEDARLLVDTHKKLDEAHKKCDPLHEQFGHVAAFPDALRAYEDALREREERRRELEDETNQWTRSAEEWRGHLPATWIMLAVSIAGLIMFALLPTINGNSGFYVLAVIFGIMVMYFSVTGFFNRRSVIQAADRMDEIETEQIDLDEAITTGDSPIPALLEHFDFETARELDGEYDRYCTLRTTCDNLRTQRDDLVSRAEETRDHVTQLKDRIAERFAQYGEEIAEEDDVHAASLRVVKKYHDYREAKRRIVEWNDRIKRYRAELDELGGQRELAQRADVELSLEVRDFMRANQFDDEAKHDSALQALRAYRIRSAQSRQKQGVVDVSQGQLKILRSRLHEEEAERDSHGAALATLLEDAGAASMDELRERADAARSLDGLEREREALQVRIAGAEQGIAPPTAEGAEPTDGGTEALSEEMTALDRKLNSKRKQEHALHIMIMERTAGQRSLNEVDEDRDDVTQRMQELELEMQAAEHAIKTIREVTQERHARLGPRLAEIASGHLNIITDGHYDEVKLGKDMHILVRLPHVEGGEAAPERRLSKGTIDQIYFAFRLAMVQCLSEGTEPLPMLLDDPFANYDDHRLARGMELLSQIAEQHQVVLFTCREDVVRAAEEVEADIFRI